MIIHLTDAGRRAAKGHRAREAHLTQALAGWRAADVVVFAQMLDQFVIDLKATPLVPNEAPARSRTRPFVEPRGRRGFPVYSAAGGR